MNLCVIRTYTEPWVLAIDWEPSVWLEIESVTLSSVISWPRFITWKAIKGNERIGREGNGREWKGRMKVIGRECKEWKECKEIEGNGRKWKEMEGNGRECKGMEGNGRKWKGMEGNGRERKGMEGNGKKFKRMKGKERK